MSFKQSLTLQYFVDESNTKFHSGWLCLSANKTKMSAYCTDVPLQGMQSVLLQISSYHCPSLHMPSLFLVPMLSFLKIRISLTLCVQDVAFFLILTLLLWLMDQFLNYKEDIAIILFFFFLHLFGCLLVSQRVCVCLYMP